MIFLFPQPNSPRHEKQEKLVERIDDEEKRLLKLMGWKDGGTESMVSNDYLSSFSPRETRFSRSRSYCRKVLRGCFLYMGFFS